MPLITSDVLPHQATLCDVRHVLMHTLRAARDEEHILRAASAASTKDLFYLQRLRHEAAHAPRRLRPTRPPPLPEIAPDSDRLWPPLPARRDGLQRLSVVLDAARRDGLLMRRGTALSSSMQRGGKVEGDGPAKPPVSSASATRSSLAVSSISPVSSASATRSLAAVGQAVGFGQAVLHAASQHTSRVLEPEASQQLPAGLPPPELVAELPKLPASMF